MKWYKSLLNLKNREEEGYFLVEGFRATEQIIKKFPDSVEEILLSETNAAASSQYKHPVRILTGSQLGSISSSQTPQGILAVVKLPEQCYSSEPPPEYGSTVLLLEHVQDPGNVGALIRTAAAFNYSGVLLSSQCADPFSPKAVQSSAGSVLSVWIRRTGRYLETVSRLKLEGLRIFAADVYGQQDIGSIGGCRHVLALGNEGSGLSDELLNISDICFRIPFDSTKAESLNVAVSGGIAMYCLKKKKERIPNSEFEIRNQKHGPENSKS